MDTYGTKTRIVPAVRPGCQAIRHDTSITVKMGSPMDNRTAHTIKRACATDDTNLHDRIREVAEGYWQQALDLYPQALAQAALPILKFDLTGRSAGEVRFAHYWRKIRPITIRFNSLIARNNPDTFINETVAHEIAHSVAVYVYGRKGLGHGRHWRRIMAGFGQPAKRCHSFDLSAVPVRRQRRFIYYCACPGERLLSTVRHKRQQRGIRQYMCPRCRSPLRFSGKESLDRTE